jgi:hypothetical protein
LQLHATCSRLQLSLGVFTIIKSNFNYFGHSYNYDATIGNFILLVGWLLCLFSSMTISICRISCNSHQISHILNIFYGDIGCIFMYVLKLYLWYITYIINIYLCVYWLCVCMYIVHIMNLKINIWTLKFIIQIWKIISQLRNVYIFEFKNWYLNLRNI